MLFEGKAAFPLRHGTSPRRAFRSVDFPHPDVPISMVKLLRGILNVMSCNVGGCSVSHPNAPSWTVTTSNGRAIVAFEDFEELDVLERKPDSPKTAVSFGSSITSSYELETVLFRQSTWLSF
jgi:hypothetical protein